MRRKLLATLVGGATVAATIGLTGSPAHALSWTITPVGNFTGANVAPNGNDGTKDLILVNNRNGAKLRCTTSVAQGNVPAAADADGIDVAKITSLSFSGCTGIGISFTVATGATTANPFWLSATESVYTPPQVDGKVDRISATITGPGCTATIGGPLSPVNTPLGTANGYYDNTAKQLVLTGSGNLTIRSNSGCFGSLLAGDSVSYFGRYQVTPAVTITSP
ncbi:hypothetical protein [Thermomonospora umbrina]|uniref:Secreted protein n=1 Tax=Thermomonospora umbrina TaxID=111806 RepID=A0A3D9SNL1_9ACTN|nr:hypothetical protein [Thermomonospora umbrina]REE95553.1 hypothetical protein DFJ69_0943 [Thermomonospora umbrina]